MKKSKRHNDAARMEAVPSSVRLKRVILQVSLAALLLVVFWRVGTHEFIYYDDGAYVFENSHVMRGWSWEGLKWAFTTTLQLHWHPLTWLSLMTDAQLFGVHAGAFHLINLLIHVLNTLLLFHVLCRMTGATYRSAFVAALFGLHPLHVEPVAWIADRKDLLNAFFWMLALWAYIRYVQRPRIFRALMVFAAFLCSLMTKSMSVTLPVVLLILDYWPLNRFAQPVAAAAQSPERESRHEPIRRVWMKSGKMEKKRVASIPELLVPHSLRKKPIVLLLCEKTLMLLPMVLGSAVTLMIIQRNRTFSIDISKALPTWDTLQGAVVAYAKYLYLMVWPVGLAIPYPRLRGIPLWVVILCLALLGMISIFAYLYRKRAPYLLAGWLWYLITLLPVIGIVRSGPHILADRYTYVPLVGIFIIIAWGANDLLERFRFRKYALGIGAGICLLACSICSWAQVGRWKNTETIFSHSVRVTRDNFVAHTNLGLALLQSGKTDEAIFHFMEALKTHPDNKHALINLGNAYKVKKDLAKAVQYYEKALAVDPQLVNAYYNMGNAYMDMNRADLAEKYFRKTIEMDPKHYRAYLDLAAAYSATGESGKALAHFEKSLEIRPDQHLAHYGLGMEYFKLGEFQKAESHLKRVLSLRPAFVPAWFNLGTLMMKRENYDEAVIYFSRVLDLQPGNLDAKRFLEEARRSKMRGTP